MILTLQKIWISTNPQTRANARVWHRLGFVEIKNKMLCQIREKHEPPNHRKRTCFRWFGGSWKSRIKCCVQYVKKHEPPNHRKRTCFRWFAGSWKSRIKCCVKYVKKHEPPNHRKRTCSRWFGGSWKSRFFCTRRLGSLYV